MWPFRRNPRVDAYREDPAVERAAANSPFDKRWFVRFLVRVSEAQAKRMIEAYTDQPGPTRHDPLEDRPEHANLFAEVEQEVTARYPERRRGRCHRVWRMKKALLLDRGLDWLSPSELNPFHRFD